MAKGYMIFVVGKETPKVVYKTFEAALFVLKKMTKNCPGEEVILFQIHKRFRFDPATGKIEKLGTHMPVGFPAGKNMYLPDLVLKKASATEIAE